MKRTIPPEKRNPTVRINRYLSMCGVSSRRKAESLVTGGEVSLNGEVIVDLGTRVDPERDKVFVRGKQIVRVHDYLYLVMNKPKDTITTMSDERGRTTVMNLLHTKERVFPIGRLDRNTTGVLLFTNDGDFAHHLMHPKFEIAKSYHVTCDRAIRPEHIAQLRAGVDLDDGATGKAQVYPIPRSKGKEVGIIIHEGRNRQVHRMFEKLGYDVAKLDRVAYGPITKEGIARGGTRKLTNGELHQLKELAGKLI